MWGGEGGVEVCHVPVVEWQSRPGKATTADTPAHVSQVIWGKIAESTTPLQDVHIFLNLTTLEWFALKSISWKKKQVLKPQQW